jgi:hypothetical protein
MKQVASSFTLIPSFGYSSNLKIDATSSSVKSAALQRTTRRNIPDYINPGNYRCEHLSSYILVLMLFDTKMTTFRVVPPPKISTSIVHVYASYILSLQLVYTYVVTLDIILFVFKTQHASDTGFCLSSRGTYSVASNR